MLKVKVVKRFRDKLDNMKIKEVGEVIEVSKERYKELVTSPFGVFVEELAKDEIIDLDNMTKKELIKYAKTKDISLDTKMTKKEMIKELI